jgi:hypothetical protein
MMKDDNDDQPNCWLAADRDRRGRTCDAGRPKAIRAAVPSKADDAKLDATKGQGDAALAAAEGTAHE